MRRIALLTAALLLTSCGAPTFTPAQRDQIADIAADTADASVAESDKVVELEKRVAELEGQVEDLTSRLDDLEKWAANP